MGCGCGCGGSKKRTMEDLVRRSVRKALYEADGQLSDVDVEEGEMHELLGVPQDEDIKDNYDSGEELARDLVDATGDESEASSMIAYAANINSEEDVFDDALDAIDRIDFEEQLKVRNTVRGAVRNALHEKQLSDVDAEEGKMSDILGVPEDEDISDAYDGSPEDAAQEVVDAVGEDEAASMINYAANISGDEFLEDMQDALKDINEQRRAIRNLVREALSEVIQEQDDNYQQFVQGTMDQLGIDDPQDLTDDGRSKFFDLIGSRYNEDEDEIEDEITDDDLADLFEPEDFAGDAPDLVKESLQERVAKRAARRLVQRIS